MKFEVQQANLIKALNSLVRNTNQQIDKYKYIQIEPTANDLIILRATNGIITISHKVKAYDVKGDVFMIEGRKLQEVVNKLKGLIVFDNGNLINGKSIIKLSVIDDKYINHITEDNDNKKTIKTKEFKKVVKNRIYATDIISRGVLSSIYFNDKDVVSTNGNILSLGNLSDSIADGDILLNYLFVDEMVKCINGDEFEFINGDKRVTVKNDEIEMSILKTDGNFPKYKQLIPKYEKEVIIDKQKVIECLELMLTITDNKNYLCVLEFDNNTLNIKANTESQAGQTSIDIDYDGEPLIMGMNILNLLNALKNSNGDVLNISFGGSLQPLIVKSDDDLHLIMPVQLRNAK